MSTENCVTLEITDAVATITIRRERALNALNQQVLQELRDSIAMLEEKTRGSHAFADVRVVLIRGAGDKAFVAGADIKLMSESNADGIRSFTDLGQSLMCELEALHLPVIAVVDGFAIGGGLELALACDLIVATENAQLGAAEVKLGLIPGFGGTQRLVRRCGVGMARRVIFTGANLSAREAQQAGIVDWCVAQESLEETLSSLCEDLKRNGPLAIAESKMLIQRAADDPLAVGLRQEVERFVSVSQSADGKEGLAAFLEKRPAQFRGC